MQKIKNLLIIVIALSAIMFTGCQNEPAPVEQDLSAYQTGLYKQFSLPEGATLESATFNIFVNVPRDRSIDIYRITSPWEEMAVTWNNFGGYDAGTLWGSFTSSANWQSVDVKSLVEHWLDPNNDNYGLLLDEEVYNAGRSRYDSRENTEKPYLHICYWDAVGTLVCEDFEAIADAYIHELNPDLNNGHLPNLFTGWASNVDLEKQSLIMFDIEPTPPELDCETAYAYDDEPEGTCFIDLGFGNWGWSIELPGTGFYTFPVYAAAGQCNLSKGTHVGDVTVDYSGGTVQFDYIFFTGFSSEETHFYAGDTPVPTTKKGKQTVAPGQYTIGTNLSGSIYIIAHAVVCGDFE